MLADVRARSELLVAKYPDPGGDASLQVLLDDAIDAAQGYTGRVIGPDGQACSTAFATACSAVPVGLERVALRAVTMMTEQMSVSAEKAMARQRSSRLRLRGFSAGSYSEQYWDPAMVRGQAGKAGGRPQVVDDPDLDDLLWQLMEDDVRDLWVAYASGEQVPAGAVTAFDFRREPGAVSGGFAPTRRAGPDGF